MEGLEAVAEAALAAVVVVAEEVTLVVDRAVAVRAEIGSRVS